MADVTKVPGPAQDPARGSREPAKPGTDKFKDLMKIDKSGEEQKKRKKRQEESEEDTKAQVRSGALRPDRGAESTTKVDKFPKIQKVGESEKRQPQHQKRSEEETALDEAAAASANTQKIESLNFEKIEASALENKSALPPSYSIEEPAEEVQIIEEEKKTEVTQAFVKKELKKESADQKTFSTPASTTIGPLFIAPPPQTAPAYTLLSPEMLALFERMVSQIYIMQANGLNETTIHLNTPEFASSLFFGAQIVIREYSTAPLAFNIEFLGTAQNTLAFEQNIGSLRAAFANEKRNYTINRVESRLLTKQERSQVRRKGKKEEETET